MTSSRTRCSPASRPNTTRRLCRSSYVRCCSKISSSSPRRYTGSACWRTSTSSIVTSICDHVLSPSGPEPEHDFSERRSSEALVEHTLLHLRQRESGIRREVPSGQLSLYRLTLGTRWIRRRPCACCRAVPAGGTAHVPRLTNVK